jgi:hypothetical protein
LVDQHLESVRDFLLKMGRETEQGAVGIVIAGVYHQINLGDHLPLHSTLKKSLTVWERRT